MKGVRIQLICVGKMKEKFYIDAAAEYVKRLSAYCRLQVVELPEERLPADPSRAQIDAALEKEGTGDTAFWSAFAAGVADKVSPSVRPYLHNPAKVTGVWRNGVLTLWVDGEFTRAMLSKPALVQTLTQEAASFFQTPQVRVSVVVGRPPAEPPASSAAAPDGERDALEDLLAFGEKYDNIKIQ